MIYLTCDNSLWEVLPTLPMNEINVVILDEDKDKYPEFPNVFMGSILLPPYEALLHGADGDYQMFDNIYLNYLCLEECRSFIIMLLAAYILKGKDIILYIDPENFRNIIPVISNHLLNYYGISSMVLMDRNAIMSIPYNRGTNHIANPYYSANLYGLFYVYGFINDEELFMMYPDPDTIPNIKFSDAVINKLISEIRPLIEDKSFMGYYNYFINKLHLTKKRGKYPRTVICEVG